jgi:hypothetical protein
MAGRGLACPVLCINKRLGKEMFDVHPFSFRILGERAITACHKDSEAALDRWIVVWMRVDELAC